MLYGEDCERKRGETLMNYTARRQILFCYLDNTGIRSPEDAREYLLLRDSKISATAWDTITTRTESSHDYNVIITSLRRFERPVPGHGGHTVAGLGAFAEITVGNVLKRCGNV